MSKDSDDFFAGFDKQAISIPLCPTCRQPAPKHIASEAPAEAFTAQLDDIEAWLVNEGVIERMVYPSDWKNTAQHSAERWDRLRKSLAARLVRERHTSTATAEVTPEQVDQFLRYSDHPSAVAWRERHTGKSGKGQQVNVMRGELSGPNEVIVLSPLTIAQLRELDSLTPRQVQALCNSHEALRHTGKG